MKKVLSILGILLLLLSCLLAVVHLNTRPPAEDGVVCLTYNNNTYPVPGSQLSAEQVQGERVNGKGERISVNSPGISMKQLLDNYNITEYSTVQVIADDGYQASASFEEVQQDTVYILFQDDEARLVVFGDSNSKRSVSDVVEIIVK